MSLGRIALLAAGLLALPLVAEAAPAKRPRGFGVMLWSDTGERIDTFRSLVTKDLVVDPDTTIALRLTASELDTLHRAVIEFRILELRQPHPAQNRGVSMDPHFAMRLVVRAGERTREFRWSTEFQPATSSAGEWRRLHGLIALVRRMVRNHAAYRALPSAQGGYL